MCIRVHHAYSIIGKQRIDHVEIQRALIVDACSGVVIEMDPIQCQFATFTATPSCQETNGAIVKAAVMNQVSCRITVVNSVPQDFKIDASGTTSIPSDPSEVQAVNAVQYKHGTPLRPVPHYSSSERIFAEDCDVCITYSIKSPSD